MGSFNIVVKTAWTFDNVKVKRNIIKVEKAYFVFEKNECK